MNINKIIMEELEKNPENNEAIGLKKEFDSLFSLEEFETEENNINKTTEVEQSETEENINYSIYLLEVMKFDIVVYSNQILYF